MLVIEDDADGAEMLADLVRTFGHDAEVARDGEAGLDLDEQWGADVVLLDLDLPRVSGFEVARRLRERRREAVVIVALSGYGRPEDRARSAAAGCDDHLTKPARIEDLVRILAGRAPG